LEVGTDVEAATVGHVRPFQHELAATVDDREVKVVAVGENPGHARQSVFEVLGRMGGHDNEVRRGPDEGKADNLTATSRDRAPEWFAC